MTNNGTTDTKPAILAPAGNKDAFLSAIAAEADAVYCGLKHFSARMEARNFTLAELARLTDIAHEKGVGVYVALNALLKTEDILDVAKLVAQLSRYVKPEALIIQDPAIINLARQAGFSGEVHLSTLANVSFPQPLEKIASELGIHRVVLPRELNIDEIKAMAAQCPQSLKFEVFVHGALCFGVSGRCYWSSFLGGKSGLQGRCVQPCRREYVQGSEKQRFFSCRDFSIDVLAKVLADIPQIAAWKIEGRKKGPHYVYYTTQAYRILRDADGDPQAKKTAVGLLERALGRPGTHFFFLPQRPYNPVDTGQQTGSGLLIGNISASGGKAVLKPREPLLSGDLLRVGYENEPWHRIQRIKKFIPKRGRLVMPGGTQKAPPAGTPVFLIDRREKALEAIMADLDVHGPAVEERVDENIDVSVHYPKPFSGKRFDLEYTVDRGEDSFRGKGPKGMWLGSVSPKSFKKIAARTDWLWLPPVIWPDEAAAFQERVNRAVMAGMINFVLNMPWQTALFKKTGTLNLWAGPFCNIANPMAVAVMREMGFSGVIVSPELTRHQFLGLPKKSCLPLGMVLSGHWPFCVSRIAAPGLSQGSCFESPRKEAAWTVSYDSNVWVFPNWQVDHSAEKESLKKAGYRCLVHLAEPVPKGVTLKKRPGKWNWDLKI